MKTPTTDLEDLRSVADRCPFCGARPHRGLGKVQHCQLHGDPFQDFSIWCPHGCAKITAANGERALEKWNRRHESADLASTKAALGEARACVAAIQSGLDRSLDALNELMSMLNAHELSDRFSNDICEVIRHAVARAQLLKGE